MRRNSLEGKRTSIMGQVIYFLSLTKAVSENMSTNFPIN